MAARNNVERLAALIGAENNISECFRRAAVEIKEEKDQKNVAMVKSFMTRAETIKNNMEALEKDTKKQMTKYNEELGKLIDAIESLSQGRIPEESTQP